MPEGTEAVSQVIKNGHLDSAYEVPGLVKSMGTESRRVAARGRGGGMRS